MCLFGKMTLTKYKKRNLIIGIAGPSGSGKTTLAKKLAKKLKAKLIHLDNYWKYNDVNEIPPMKKWKKGIWEKPSATNFKKLLKDIKKIRKSKEFSNIILEGLHTFDRRKIRKIIDFKIYVNLSDSLIVKRRLKKFGHSNSQEWYSKNVVIKFYKKYGEPKKVYADLVLNGEKDVNSNIEKILTSFNKLK